MATKGSRGNEIFANRRSIGRNNVSFGYGNGSCPSPENNGRDIPTVVTLYLQTNKQTSRGKNENSSFFQ